MSTFKSFSFEFSAPRTPLAKEKLKQAHSRLSALSPHYFSVTYGAGGTTREGTREAVLDLLKTGTAIAPHLSFGDDAIDQKKEAIVQALLAEYQAAGVTRLVVLRGDVPSGTGASSQLTHASDLVAFIRQVSGEHFHIDVAAYPEMHPESPSVDLELEHFQRKVDAGADSAITQYFYNADAYFRFVDACHQRGMTLPIVPGIMPLTNYQGITRFSARCGAEIPRWIEKHLLTYQHDPASLQAFGLEVVTAMCQRLLDGGAPGLHFYTLNQARPSMNIWKALGL